MSPKYLKALESCQTMKLIYHSQPLSVWILMCQTRKGQDFRYYTYATGREGQDLQLSCLSCDWVRKSAAKIEAEILQRFVPGNLNVIAIASYYFQCDPRCMFLHLPKTPAQSCGEFTPTKYQRSRCLYHTCFVPAHPTFGK